MTTDPRDSLELRLTLRRLEAAEVALADARRSLTQLIEKQSTPAPSPPPAPAPAPAPAPPPPPQPPAPAPATPARPPVPTETKVIRAVAVAGSLITVAGVGLGVALAIQAGLLGPLGRVLLSTLLAVALLAAGLWLDTRRRGAQGVMAGVTALIVTAWLVAAVILYALVEILHWWPAWLAVLTLMVVWAGLLVVTVARSLRWVVFFLGLTILPVVVAFHLAAVPTTWLVLLMPVSLLVAAHDREHPPIRVMAGIVAVLTLLFASQQVTAGFAVPRASAVAIVLICLGTALAFAAFSLRYPTSDARADLVATILVPFGLFVPAVLPASGTWAVWLLIPTAVGLAALGYRHRHLLGMVGVCGTAVSFVLVWQHTPPFGAGARVDATIVVAVFFVAAALAVLWLAAREEDRVAPWAFWLGAALVVTFTLSRNVLATSPLWLTDHIAAVQAVLIAVFLGVVLSRRHSLARLEVWAQVVFAVAGLHLSMVTVVTLATWAGHLIGGTSGMWLGYLVGHALVSILWMVLAAWILLAAPGLTERGSLGAGMVLAVAAVVKLVFFDLGTLEGLPRALAFLVSGIALLAMASLRTRRRSGQSTSARN